MKTTIEVDAADIPTMARMAPDEYRSYLQNELLFVDHHDVLRSQIAQYPVAVTPAQLEILIDYLTSLRPRFASGDNADR